jgi:ATP-dependent Clp protease ATP-binding subunit ClpC
VIMTSNIGSRQLKEFGQGVGFQTSSREASRSSNTKSVIENALRKSFAPEFLNRIDDVIIFEDIKREDIHRIVDIELAYVYNRIAELGYKIELAPAAREFIIDRGWDPNFGARPLKRAIQKYVEDNLAEEIIKSHLKEGDIIKIDFDESKEDIVVHVVPRGKPPKEKKENKKSAE